MEKPEREIQDIQAVEQMRTALGQELNALKAHLSYPSLAEALRLGLWQENIVEQIEQFLTHIDQQKQAIISTINEIQKLESSLTEKSKENIAVISAALDPLVGNFEKVSRVARIYMARFNTKNPGFFTENNIPYYFVVAWNIAQKYLSDEPFWTAGTIEAAKDRGLLSLPEPVNPLNSSIKFSFNDAESFFLNTINWDTAIKESNL